MDRLSTKVVNRSTVSDHTASLEEYLHTIPHRCKVRPENPETGILVKVGTRKLYSGKILVVWTRGAFADLRRVGISDSWCRKISVGSPLRFGGSKSDVSHYGLHTIIYGWPPSRTASHRAGSVSKWRGRLPLPTDRCSPCSHDTNKTVLSLPRLIYMFFGLYHNITSRLWSCSSEYFN